MKKLFFVLTFALALSAVSMQADPPIPGCPDICQTVPAGN